MHYAHYIHNEFSFLLSGVDVVYKPFRVDDPLHEFRKSLALIRGSFSQVGDHTGVKIDLDFIAVLDFRCRFGALNDGKADVDGIAVENPGKAGGDDEPQPKFFSATMMSPFCTFLMNSLSISSIQCVASSAGSEEFR